MRWYVHYYNMICDMDWCISQQPAITFIVMSLFLVIAVFMPACVLCKHFAGRTCILHCCALFNNYYTWLPTHQLHLYKRRKKLAPHFPSTVLLHSLLALWQLSKWHFMDFMQRISQTRNNGRLTSMGYTTRLYGFGNEDEETYEINRS